MRPYKIARNWPIVSHPLYVDNRLIFANGAKDFLKNLMKFLSTYVAASGQEIKLSKSNFMVHHSIPQARRHIIHQPTSFSESNFPFLYLEAPISYKKLSVNDFNFLFRRLLKRLHVRKVNCYLQESLLLSNQFPLLFLCIFYLF